MGCRCNSIFAADETWVWCSVLPMRALLLLLAALLAQTSVAFALPELAEESFHMKGQVELARDPANLSFDRIMEPGSPLRFEPSREDMPVFGLDRAAVWVRFAARLAGDEEWTFSIGIPSTREVTAFMPRGDGTYDRIDKGMAHGVPEGTRWAFPLSGAAKAGQVVYVKVSSVGSLRLPMSLEKATSFRHRVLQETVFLGALLGLLAAVGLYVFAVWLAMRDPAQLRLSLVVGALLLWTSSNIGFLSEFVFPSHSLAASVIATPAVILALAASVSFTCSILFLPERMPRVARAATAWTAFLCAMAVVMGLDLLFKDGWTRHFVVYLLFPTLIGVFGLGIQALVKGVPTARLFLLGWTPTLAAALARGLVDDRVIPLNVFTNNAVFIGIAVSVMSFAVALAMSIRRRDRMAAEALMDATRKRAESERLAALGELAGGVAHEVNNLLHPIANFVKEARRSLPPNAERVVPLLDRAHAAALSAGEIVRKVLDFSRQVTTVRPPVDLTGAVSAALETLRPTLRPGLKLEAVLCEGALPVRATKTEVMQVLANLIANSSYVEHGASRLQVVLARGRAASGPIAVLSVEDDGRGIAPEFRSKIFEPFFTTKPIGQGTGLGLALVSATVKAWGGSTQVQAAADGGACFVFHIPLAEEAVVPAAAGRITVSGTAS